MYLNAHLKVIINGSQVYSIVSCETNNDAHNVGAWCEVVLPLNSRIQFNGQEIDSQIDNTQISKGYLTAPTRYIFNTGDTITVKAKYDGYEKDPNADSDGYLKVFEGFLYDFHLTTPIKIKCLDYIYWFNMGLFGNQKLVIPIGKGKKKNKTKAGTGVSYPNVKFKELINDLLSWVNDDIDNWNEDNGTNIAHVTLFEPMFDMDLVNISFVNMSPAAVLEWFKRELGLCITFLGTQLYVNVASFTTNTVKLQTDINVLQSDLQTTNLKNPKKKSTSGSNSVFLRLKVKAWFIKPNGTKDSIEVGDPNGQLREVFFYNVKQDATLYNTMANEALNKFMQARFSGDCLTLLYPYFDVFWKVQYTDIRYPERNGNYICTLQKQTFNENGFHRKSKLAYLDQVI